MKNKEGIWRLEYLEPPINEELDEQNDLNDDQILKLFFGIVSWPKGGFMTSLFFTVV